MPTPTHRPTLARIVTVAAALLLLRGQALADEPASPPNETPQQATQRHARVAERRAKTHILCHRGASELAHENTLEAYRASFELGADGNEIDIRATKDGVLVCFHDDMLDHLLVGYGDVSDYAWEELQRLKFRAPGPFGEQCRIPMLKEVFELHRQHSGLLHLDIKRPNLDRAIAQLLDEFDLWDSVAYVNTETAGSLLKDPRLKLCRYKAGLYQDHSEVFPEAIAAALQLPGEGLIVNDPRGAVVALQRKIGPVSSNPVALRPPLPSLERPPRSEKQLVAELLDAADWNTIAQSPEAKQAAGRRITARAKAADELAMTESPSAEAFAALERRVRERSLHKDWLHHGVDGASSLRVLIQLHAPQAVDLARFALWRDDPALAAVANPQFSNPTSWTDFRAKMIVFPALVHWPNLDTEQLCRDYLALDEEAALKLGPPQFEEAARTLLAVSPTVQTAHQLLHHRLRVVRGRAILDCLAHAEASWAQSTLKSDAPWAMEYVIPKEARASAP